MNEALVGIAVSPGIAIAHAHRHFESAVLSSDAALDDSDGRDALMMFEMALHQTTSQLEVLRDKVSAQVGRKEAAIFAAHLAIANDASLANKVRQLISERQHSVEDALNNVLSEYESLFSRVDDDYLRERLVDVRDVLGRIAKQVRNAGSVESTSVEPVILVAHELLPSDIVAVAESNVVGVVTASGGRTSHAAILARSYGIPSVSGVSAILSTVNNGDTIIVDGGAGRVFVAPDDALLQTYGELRRESVAYRNSLVAIEPTQPKTKDGTAIELLANIRNVADAAEAKRVGASGVGLYRTEFFYLTCTRIPTEDEQVAEYRRVFAAAPDGPITIRTFDLGGDKTIPFLHHAPEANPFMGWRSIRLSFEHPALLLQQIRAVFQTSSEVSNDVQLLFPMITTYDELQQIRGFVDAARTELRDDCEAWRRLRLGMMLEVPAAAVMLSELLDEVDFVSIGTNDLVQYLTAADRDNPKVSHLCQALSPAVLRVLANAIAKCRAANKPVSVCGEMAGSVRAFPVLLGMGLRSFSMSPSFIPVIRDLAEFISIDEAEDIYAQVSTLMRATEIQTKLDEWLLRLKPELRHFLIA